MNEGSSSPDKSAPLDLGPLPDLLGYQLRRAQIAAFQSLAGALGGDGVSPGQFGVLLLVAANPGVNQTRVGNALGIDRSTLVAVLDRLEGRQLLARRPSPADRRSHALVLTETGRSYLEDELMPRIERHERDIARRLSAAERRTLIGLLQLVSGE